MTCLELYTDALAALGQKPGDNPRWDDSCPGRVNLLLAEALNTENALRRFEGLAELAQPPRVTALSDTLPCRPGLLPALTFGLAAFLWDEADEGYKAQDYRGRYVQALREALRTRPEGIVNCYA